MNDLIKAEMQRAEERCARKTMNQVKKWLATQKAMETKEAASAVAEQEGKERYELATKHAYDPEICEVVADLVSEGWAHKKIAAYLGIHLSTLYKWRKAYEELDAAMSPTDAMTNEIEMSVFGRAKGYKYIAERPMSIKGELEIARYEETVHPDMTAAKMWLQAHSPHKWSEKSMVAHEVRGLQEMLKEIGESNGGLDSLGNEKAIEEDKPDE